MMIFMKIAQCYLGGKELMDADITDLELLAALKTCDNLAPGSNGIPYNE